MKHVMGGVMWTLQSNMTKAFNNSGLVGNDDSANATSSFSGRYVSHVESEFQNILRLDYTVKLRQHQVQTRRLYYHLSSYPCLS